MANELMRTSMYAGGTSPVKMIQAAFYNEDCIVYDLEDSVSAGEKDAARFLVYNAVKYQRPADKYVIVRVNGIYSKELDEDRGIRQHVDAEQRQPFPERKIPAAKDAVDKTDDAVKERDHIKNQHQRTALITGFRGDDKDVVGKRILHKQADEHDVRQTEEDLDKLFAEQEGRLCEMQQEQQKHNVSGVPHDQIKIGGNIAQNVAYLRHRKDPLRDLNAEIGHSGDQ